MSYQASRLYKLILLYSLLKNESFEFLAGIVL
jgi:hypothetical protein